jgi:hypothetical protein
LATQLRFGRVNFEDLPAEMAFDHAIRELADIVCVVPVDLTSSAVTRYRSPNLLSIRAIQIAGQLRQLGVTVWPNDGSGNR